MAELYRKGEKDGLGNQVYEVVNTSYVSNRLSIVDVDNHIASHEAEIVKLKAMKVALLKV